MQVFLWVAVLSLLFAAAAIGVIAWRTSRGAHDRESARIELLRALAFPDPADMPTTGPLSSRGAAGILSEQEPVPSIDTYEAAPPIFGERDKPLTTLPRWVSLSAVGVAMAVGVTLYAVLAGSPEAGTVATPAARATGAPEASARADARKPATANRPIEVIGLEHRFGGATGFYVSGRVRNPDGGRSLPDLRAVVDLLDADGHILTSQTTPLERPVLEAGQTSAFSLAFPRVTGTVARYQVVFRLHGRDSVPHVDRRAAGSGAASPSS